jgi:predicted O-methyltransferase YrrM
MESAAKAVLAEYDARMASERALMESLSDEEFGRRLDEFLLPVGPDTGQFLATLVKAAAAKTVLEIGTSYGYSTLWLADGAQAVGGTVHTLELSQAKSDYARQHIGRAGLGGAVKFHVGDARELIAGLNDPIDLVLLDLWKDLYIPCFDLVYPKLSKGAFVVADNMLLPESSQTEAAAYREHVRTKAGITSVLLPIGSGVEVTRFD